MKTAATKISVTFGKYQKRTPKSERLDIPNSFEELEGWRREIERQATEQSGVIDHLNKVIEQLTAQKHDIEVGAQSTLQTAKVQTAAAISSATAAGSTTGTIIPLTQALVAGWQTITFNKSSSIIDFPQCFGVVRAGQPPQQVAFQYDLTLLPNSFRINPVIAATMYMSYQNL